MWGCPSALTRQLTSEAREGELPLVYIKKACITLILLVGILIPGVAGAAGLRSGDDGEMVYELQERLAALHYDVAVDGDFGSQTEKAVSKFQQDNGLAADGVVGKTTWDILVRLSPESSRGSRPAGDQAVTIARRYISTPYVFGGTGPGGFDCSGFTQYVFRQMGISLTRMADGQYGQGMPVGEGLLRVGDLVFFSTYEAGPSHVGIFAGNGRFIHAGSSTGVTVSSLYDSYWGPRYIGARRVIR